MLKEYEFYTRDGRHITAMLSPEDAERYGATLVETKVKTVQNKARRTRTKASKAE